MSSVCELLGVVKFIFKESKYFAVDCSISSGITLFVERRGCLYPFPTGFLEFSMSKSRSIVLTNLTVPLLF